MHSLKLAYDTRDGHVASGTRSHAEIIGTSGAAYDAYVRAIVFPEKKAVYFRYFGTDDETAFKQAGHALDKFISLGFVKRSWKTLWWATDEKRVTSWDVRL